METAEEMVLDETTTKMMNAAEELSASESILYAAAKAYMIWWEKHAANGRQVVMHPDGREIEIPSPRWDLERANDRRTAALEALTEALDEMKAEGIA